MKRFFLAFSLSLVATTHAHAIDLFDTSKKDTEQVAWTGHTSPDADTVVSAMLAAHIFGGKATIPGEPNPETNFILDYCGAKAPESFSDYSSYKVGLVDFNQKTQLHPTIKEESIVAVIDHHAIGGSPINTAQLVSMDIRAWGSTAAILADKAEQLDVPLPKELACATVGAILSDTVVFDSSTTTDYDRKYAEKLAKSAKIKDIHDFGAQMLIAKSDLSHLSANEILVMDYKNFEFGGKAVGIGVAETLTAKQLIDRRDELVAAMKEYKKKNKLDYLFFSITDTKNKRANILWVDNGDLEVLETAFETNGFKDMLSLDGVTSRKRQIGPAIQKAVENL